MILAINWQGKEMPMGLMWNMTVQIQLAMVWIQSAMSMNSFYLDHLKAHDRIKHEKSTFDEYG
jgi:hypothetical protein